MKKHAHRQLPVYQLVLIDCALIAFCLLAFAYFDHVRPTPGQAVAVFTPRENTNTPKQPADETEGSSDKGSDDTESQNTTADASGMFHFEGVFTDGEVIATENSYKSSRISVTTSNIVYSSATSKYDQSIWIEDVYVRDVECISCVFAEDTFGSNILEKFESMASRSNSIAAINTDFYGFGKNSNGIVIRNGVLYRSEPNPKDDVMVLYHGGNMVVYRAGSVPSAEELMEAGAWQAFSFGPLLLENGAMLPEYEDIDRNPRTVFGMVEPGHYIFIVADGGTSGYAKGFTYKGMAQIALDLGCKIAYNLDGGQSSQMGFMGKYLDHPENGGRRLSDILIVKD